MTEAPEIGLGVLTKILEISFKMNRVNNDVKYLNGENSIENPNQPKKNITQA